MAKKALKEDELYQAAIYLSNPEADTEIHAEMLLKNQKDFEENYKRATEDYPLPDGTEAPYYIWPPDANKYGRELRIYFKRVPPEPPIIKTLYTDHGKWYAKRDKWRINHSALVMQLFECGFVLGENADKADRIQTFMKRRFPTRK